MHLAGEFFVAREICFGCSDTGLVFGPYGLGYSLNLYLHLRDLKTMSVSCELTRRQSRCIPFRLLHLVPSPPGAGPPFSALGGVQVRSERGGQSQAHLHAGRSHRLLAFVEYFEGFVETLVHTSRRAKRGMSPSCTTLSCGNCGQKSGAGMCSRFIRSRAVVRVCGTLGHHHQLYARFAMSLPTRLQAASSEYQKLQVDLSNAVEARQRLDAQLSENELVKKVREPKLVFFWCAVATKF